MRMREVLLFGLISMAFFAKAELANRFFFTSDVEWQMELNDVEQLLSKGDSYKDLYVVKGVVDQLKTRELLLRIEILLDKNQLDEARENLEVLKSKHWEEKEIRKAYFYFEGKLKELDGSLRGALESFEKSLYLSLVEKNDNFAALSHIGLSTTYYFLGENNKGLANAIKAESLTSSDQLKYFAKEEIAMHLLELERLDESFNFLNDNLTYAKSVGDSNAIAQTLGYLGLVHYRNGAYEKSVDFQHEALYIRTIIGDELGVGESSNNLFLPLAKLDRYGEAEPKLLTALEIFERNGDVRQIPVIQRNLAEVYLKLGQPDLFFKYINESIELSKRNGDPTTERSAYSLLADYHAGEGNFKEAFHYHTAEVKIGDSLRQLNSSNEDLYAALQEVKATKKEYVQESSSKKVWWISLVAGGSFLPFMFYRMRKRMLKAETELEAIKALKSGVEPVEAIVRVNKDPKLKEALLNMKIHTKEDALNFKQKFAALYPELYLNMLEKYPNLTEAEKRMLMLIRLGINNDMLADKLAVSASAVRVTKFRLRKKLNVQTDEELRASLLLFSQN